MKKFLIISACLILAAGAFAALRPRQIAISNDAASQDAAVADSKGNADTPATPPPPAEAPAPVNGNDEPAQSKLTSPPAIVKGIYLTGWTAGLDKRVGELIDLIKRKNLNAVVVDIKDYSGFVSYRTNVAQVRETGAEGDIRITRPNALLKRFHDNGIYVIGRVSVFQDPILAKSHPEWAIKNKNTGQPWRDNKGLAWMDAAAQPVWDYHVAIAKDAFDRGFDEIQFDYVRFPSDGKLSLMSYPYWNQQGPRSNVLRRFYSYMREQLPEQNISADLFGLAAVNKDDLGIGQVIEDAYAAFDEVSPMIYPSHYASGFLGFKNPAQHPYEVIKYSMEQALARLKPKPQAAASSSTPPVPPKTYRSKLRPWLQVFDLGATYNREMIQKQVQAIEDVLASHPDAYAGYLFWDPKNLYSSL